MTRLLVSVRDATEAAAALAGGADFIDVKEPARGALGFADGQTLREISSFVGDAAILSAALGEIDESMPNDTRAALAGFKYIKLGLAGARAHVDWPQRWYAALSALPADAGRVAVVYADWQTCGAPSPAEVFQHASELRPKCSALLIDTFAKHGLTSFDFMPPKELAATISKARDHGWLTLLAGALRRDHLPHVRAIDPDVVAVRGAVCIGGRSGKLLASLVTEFQHLLARESHEGDGVTHEYKFA